MNHKKNIVYILGAGASKHLGGPLVKDFVNDGLGFLYCNMCPDTTRSSFEKVDELVKFFDKNSSSIKCSKINIECLLDKVQHDVSLPNNNDYLAALYEFIYVTLELSVLGEGRNPNRNMYTKLINNVINPNNDNCFISFNYDLFLDRAVSINNHGLLGNYNILFSHVKNFNGYENRFLQGARKKIDVDILKLHGSLNWAKCSSCDKMQLSYFDSYNNINCQSCESCGSSLSPALIPPLKNKYIESSELVSVWDKAKEKLIAADEIIVIGYSFPESDTAAKNLLTNALVKSGKRPKLVIVDPDPAIVIKIIKMVSVWVDKIYEYCCFEEYCARNSKKVSNDNSSEEI